MFGITNITTFIAAGIFLNLTPGADTIYIIGRSVSQGKKAGVYSALGIVTGVLLHTCFAAFGLSLIIARSTTAYNIVRYLGAIYIGYLGLKMIMTRPTPVADVLTKKIKSHKLYIAGILTNLFNPKVALFFLVFLPQFVKAPEIHNPIPFLILGIIFIIPGTIWCLFLAVSAARFSRRFRENTVLSLWLSRITGVIFIAIGLRLALLSKKITY